MMITVIETAEPYLIGAIFGYVVGYVVGNVLGYREGAREMQKYALKRFRETFK